MPMASGKPIVATSIDGFREVVTHGRDGLLVERKSRRQLSYALQTLIIQQSSLRVRMRELQAPDQNLLVVSNKGPLL